MLAAGSAVDGLNPGDGNRRHLNKFLSKVVQRLGAIVGEVGLKRRLGSLTNLLGKNGCPPPVVMVLLAPLVVLAGALPSYLDKHFLSAPSSASGDVELWVKPGVV